jgi:hypothetical protein
MKNLDQQIEKSSVVAAGKQKARRPYKKPELAIYGKLAELTAGVNGSMPDPGHSTPTRR